MKRNTFKYIVLALLLAFVSRNETFAQEVNRSTAKRVAETFLNKNVRGGRGASIQLHDITAETEFQNFYILSADSGFVIVAADERVTPILGYSNTSRFVTEDMPENLRSWLMGYEEEIQAVKNNALLATSEAEAEWSALIAGEPIPFRGDRGNMISGMPSWNQDSGHNSNPDDLLFNNHCPYDTQKHEYCVTGCVATAMAQILRKWQYPNQAVGGYYEYTLSNPHGTYVQPIFSYFSTEYDWDNMPLVLSANSSDAQKEAVAVLMKDCGVSVNMNYGVSSVGGSEATSSSVPYKNRFDYCSIAEMKSQYCYSDEVWKSMLRNEIDHDRPVHYRGSSRGGGHAFVCYGYDDNDMFLFNWGWGGSHNNDHYAIGALSPGIGGTGSGYGQYNSYNRAIFYIMPKDRNLSAPTNLMLEYNNGNTIQLSWSASSGAISYIVLRNGKYLAETTQTWYNDSEVYSGYYSYQVMAVGSNYHGSLPTEIVTYTIPYDTPSPSSLMANATNSTVTLTWDAPANPTIPFFHHKQPFTGSDIHGVGGSNHDVCDMYELFRPFELSAYANRYLTRIDYWVSEDVVGKRHTLIMYKGDFPGNSHELLRHVFTPTNSGTMWYYFPTPIKIDGNKDICVDIQVEDTNNDDVFYYLESNDELISSFFYSEKNARDGVVRLPYGQHYIIDLYAKWAEELSYNIYRSDGQNVTCVARNIQELSYANVALPNGTYSYYVTTNYYGGESEPSNIQTITITGSSYTSAIYHCWFDQDYATVQTGTFGGNGCFLSLDASSLDEGLHTLHVMLDDNGLTAPKTYLFLKTLEVLPVSSYNYHCWFDQDYSTVQTGTFGGGGYSVALDASALEDGIHTLHVMLEGNDLTASKTYLFLKTPEVLPVSSYTYHCWFDQDYSTVQTGSFGGEGYSFALDADELEDGIHTVHVMLEGNDLSASKTYIFLKAPVASSTETYTYHCWFDQDYETVQTGSFGGEGYSFALDASELDEGIHTMHVMLEGSEFSAAKTYLFLKAPVASPTSTYTYHCWFDQDYTTVQTGTFGGEGYSFALDVDGIDNGLHFVNVMLEGNELSSAKRYLFCKKPIGGSGIYRWEYCLNGQWSDAVATTLVPTVQTLDILTMLPVDHLPIRSEDFEFEPNGGQPEIYAKNTITFRFWDDENRFLDRSAVYVDATMHEPVVADWIQRNTTETIATPAANHIHWFKLDAEVGDSLAFKSDVYCTMELFAPSGARQFKVMNAASVAFNGICANESGIYYLAVHDVEGSYENVSVTYLFLREMTAVTALNAGWNWWTPTVWTDISTLQSTLSDYLIQIQVQDEMPTGNINPGKMLKIQTSAACALSLRGMPITAASITVNPGATWFGYIGVEAPITQALNGFPPAVDDKIISQDGGFAVYNGMEWEGTLTTLEPGKGYVYVSTAAWSKTIVFE